MYQIHSRLFRNFRILTIACLSVTYLMGQESGKWEVRNKVDQMTDETVRQGILVVDAESNGRHGDFQVTATCNDHNDELVMDVIYISHFRVGVGFIHEQQDPTIFGGQVYSHSPKVLTRVRVDQGPVETIYVPSEARNEVRLRFAGEFNQTLGSATSQLSAQGKSKAFYGAQQVRLQFTLDNGDTPILILNPQETSFKKFASECPWGPESSESAHTPDDFAELIPKILQKAAVEHGLEAHSYDKEAALITAAVKTCSRITQKMAATVPIDSGAEKLSALGPDFDACESRSYSEHYKMDASTLAGNSHGALVGSVDDRLANNVLFKINQREDTSGHNHLWRDTKGFYIFIGISDYNSYVLKDFYIRRALS